jgi:hypothetical protein
MVSVQRLIQRSGVDLALRNVAACDVLMHGAGVDFHYRFVDAGAIFIRAA